MLIIAVENDVAGEPAVFFRRIDPRRIAEPGVLQKSCGFRPVVRFFQILHDVRIGEKFVQRVQIFFRHLPDPEFSVRVRRNERFLNRQQFFHLLPERVLNRRGSLLRFQMPELCLRSLVHFLQIVPKNRGTFPKKHRPETKFLRGRLFQRFALREFSLSGLSCPDHRIIFSVLPDHCLIFDHKALIPQVCSKFILVTVRGKDQMTRASCRLGRLPQDPGHQHAAHAGDHDHLSFAGRENGQAVSQPAIDPVRKPRFPDMRFRTRQRPFPDVGCDGMLCDPFGYNRNRHEPVVRADIGCAFVSGNHGNDCP